MFLFFLIMGNYESKRVEYKTVKDFMKDAVPCSLQEDVQRKLEQ